MEGIMMRGADRVAIAVRLPDDQIYLKTEKVAKPREWTQKPIIRGVFAFIMSLVMGTKVLMESADILEDFTDFEVDEGPSKMEIWLEERFGPKAYWNLLIYASVVFALAISILVFVLLPTVVVDWLGIWIESAIVLNLIEGFFRLGIFVLYVLAIRKVEDIKTTFRYHGAEHKTIHCFENNLELTPENAQSFYTLHPRCGTSFLMFVLVIAIIVFSLCGWPSVWMRILSRLLLIPVIAGLSYELLKWAGSSDNLFVKILSIPGLLLQKLTTAEPTNEQLEVAIVALKAVLVDKHAPLVEGICDKDANIIEAGRAIDLGKRAKEKGEEDVLSN
ncbi:MAG: DUF1385 domain-containing protein [Clostridia bacterium]|nr:DUF1385 domain-containing protein [Clostridia bacterium]